MTPAGIDVIVPCYNYGRYLRACAASVLRETRLPVRLLILDDASSDDTAWLTAEGAMASSAAALRKLRPSATAARTASWESCTRFIVLNDRTTHADLQRLFLPP